MAEIWPGIDQISTIYIGGGTPSLLSPTSLQEILDAVQTKFRLNPSAEITLEANPDDINPESLREWKSIGINRLSVGIQSFDEAELRWMNRAHTASESLTCLTMIPAAGFDNYSIDLIYGSPLQTHSILRKNLDIVFQHAVPHISAYALTVESGTALHHRIVKKQQPPVDTDHQAEQFEILLAEMRQQGYEPYEISNFCKPGYRSRHNSSYWQGKPYYGFGASAHSYNGHKIRSWNIANNSLYIASIQQGKIPFEEEILSETQQLNEQIMIALRTLEGIDLEKIKSEFGEKASQGVLERAQKYINLNHLFLKNNRLTLSDSGRFLADGIAAEMFIV